MCNQINSIQLELTNKCNFSCKKCSHNATSSFKEFASHKLVEIVSTGFNNLKHVHLSGIGEPLLHPELFEIISCLSKHRKLFLSITTNGSLLSESICEKIVESDLGMIDISLDYSSEVTFNQNISKNYSLNKIHSNIATLLEIRAKTQKRKPKINLVSVLSTVNLNEIANIIFFAGKHKIDNYYLINYNPQVNEVYTPGNIAYPELQSKSIEWRQIAKENNINFSLPPFPVADCDEIINCNWLNNSIFINCRGDVLPCCLRTDDVYAFGNIFEKSFAEIWSSNYYVQSRKSLNENRSPPFCKNCLQLHNRLLPKMFDRNK